MKKVKQTIVIDRSAHEVFNFTLNPENTPKWIDSIVTEHTNETPTKLGTVYKNQDPEGNWKEYEVTAFEPDTMFVFSRRNGSYHVKYTLKSLNDSQCELEYSEWDENGDMSELFDSESLKKVLEKLKTVVEK